MPDVPYPILIFGDPYTSKNQIAGLKKKHPEYNWVALSATELEMDEIISEVGTEDIFSQQKGFIIQDIPNKKEVRTFLLDLIARTSDAKLVIWDSFGHIKKDTKTGTILKTWDDFVKNVRSINGAFIKNNGDPYTEKSIEDCVEHVKRLFDALGKKIESREAHMFIQIVGYDRGMLDSEARKLALISTAEFIDMDLIIENAYPVTQEAILYKFSNTLDSGSYSKIAVAIEEFLDAGVNGNVLAEIMLKKVRWQLATVSWYRNGHSWPDISNRLMEMGNFPSEVWHSDLSFNERKEASEKYTTYDEVMNYLTQKQGLPARHFNLKKPKVKMLKSGKPSKAQPKLELKKGEKLPMKFIADQTISSVRHKVFGEKRSTPELKNEVLEKLKRAYADIYEHLVDVRFNKNVPQSLNEMGKIISEVMN
jgi:DNA polymerase III delta subunit